MSNRNTLGIDSSYTQLNENTLAPTLAHFLPQYEQTAIALEQALESANTKDEAINVFIEMKQFYTNLKDSVPFNSYIHRMNSLLQNAFQDESNSIQCAYVKAIGDLYFKLKKLLCAYVTYNLALSLEPSNSILWFGIGSILEIFKQNQEATHYYRQSLRLNKFFPEAWNSLGNVYTKQLKYNEAIFCFQQSQKMKPRSSIQQKLEILFSRISQQTSLCNPLQNSSILNSSSSSSLAQHFLPTSTSTTSTKNQFRYQNENINQFQTLPQHSNNTPQPPQQQQCPPQNINCKTERRLSFSLPFQFPFPPERNSKKLKLDENGSPPLLVSENSLNPTIIEQPGVKMNQICNIKPIENPQSPIQTSSIPSPPSTPSLTEIASTEIEINENNLVESSNSSTGIHISDINKNQDIKEKVSQTSQTSPKTNEPDNNGRIEVPILPCTDDLSNPLDREKAFMDQKTFCFNNSIVLIKGLSDAVGFDFSLFFSENLLKSHQDQSVEVRVQKYQAPDINMEHGKEVWYCTSTKKMSTVGNFAKYQKSFLEKSSEGNTQTPSTIEFCTNVDLSDELEWKKELDQIKKLPTFLQVNSVEDMLYYYGHPVLGMNLAQMYLKVPGCRTPGHQENNNFCSVNLNVGPGDCEWFATDPQYWRQIDQLCRKKNLNFLRGSWWPSIKDLQENQIPYYRFTQKKGDIVYVNAGTVHWVQALGVCNNIAWNCGPLTAHQFTQAIERYEANEEDQYKSIAPMETIAWNMTFVQTDDLEFYPLLDSFLSESLTRQKEIEKKLKKRKLNIFEFSSLDVPAYYCMKCNCELFNYVIVKDVASDSGQSTYCEKCSLNIPKSKPLFVYRKYPISELTRMYQDFQDFISQLQTKN